jgi:ankyrin repeat protein
VYVRDYSVVSNFLSIHVIGLGNASVVEKLIAARCNVNIQEMNGLTPLFIAAKRGYHAITGQLIAAGCDVDLQTKDERFPVLGEPPRWCLGETALHVAALFGNEAVTKQLIAASCKIDLLEENGQTALHYAVKNGYVAIAEQLIVARCNVDLQNKHGCTPFYIAAQNRCASISLDPIIIFDYQCGHQRYHLRDEVVRDCAPYHDSEDFIMNR